MNRRTTLPPLSLATRTAMGTVLGLVLSGTPSLAQTPEGSPPAAAKRADEPTRIDLQVVKAEEVGVLIERQLGIPVSVISSANCLILSERPDLVSRAAALAHELDRRADQLLQEQERRRRDEVDRQEELEERAAREQAARLDDLSLTVDFPGGTVAEYLDLVQAASGLGNVIVGDKAILALTMPPVKVRRVTGTAAIMLLQTLRFEVNGTSVRMTVETTPGDPDGKGIDALPVHVLDLDPGSRKATQSDALRTEVVNLSAYQKYEPSTVKELLAAIELGVGMQDRSAPIDLKLHEGTGLLFVRGTEEDLRLVTNTIRTFAGNRPEPSAK